MQIAVEEEVNDDILIFDRVSYIVCYSYTIISQFSNHPSISSPLTSLRFSSFFSMAHNKESCSLCWMMIAGDGIDVWSNLLRANLLLPVLCFYSLCEGEGLHSLLCLSHASARAAWCAWSWCLVLYCGVR